MLIIAKNVLFKKKTEMDVQKWVFFILLMCLQFFAFFRSKIPGNIEKFSEENYNLQRFGSNALIFPKNCRIFLFSNFFFWKSLNFFCDFLWDFSRFLKFGPIAPIPGNIFFAFSNPDFLNKRPRVKHILRLLVRIPDSGFQNVQKIQPKMQEKIWENLNKKKIFGKKNPKKSISKSGK